MQLFFFNLVHKMWSVSSTLKSNIIDAFNDAFVYPPAQNMNGYVRLELLIIGCIFLLTPMIVDIAPHWLMLLPLMSIYLISSAIIGYEPLYATIKRFGKHHHWHHHKPASISHS